MTILFRLKNNSYEDSIRISFPNLKEKLEEHQKEISQLDVKFIKSLIRILVDFNHGKNNKHVDCVVVFVITFPGMVIICTNIGRKEIELS